MHCLVSTCKTDFRLSAADVAEGGSIAHSIPKASAVRQKWIYAFEIFCGMSFTTKTPEELDALRICSKHFLPTDFVIQNDQRLLLKNGAFPTIFAKTGREESEDIEVLFPEECALNPNQNEETDDDVLSEIPLYTIDSTSKTRLAPSSLAGALIDDLSTLDTVMAMDCDKSSASSNEEVSNILLLNDDCLRLIFEEVGLMDLIALRKTCIRFEAISCDLFRRHTFFDFAKLPGYTSFEEGKDILENVGPFIEHLSIRGTAQNQWFQPSYDVQIYPLIASHCPNLKNLELRHFKPVSFKGLEALSEAFKLLEGLKLFCCCRVADNFGIYLRRAKNLRRLELFNCEKVTGKCLKYVKNLTHLSLIGCDIMTTAPFIAAINNNRGLEHLSIICCFTLTKGAIDYIAENLNELVHLECTNRYKYTYPVDVAVIAKLPKLTKVKIQPIADTPFSEILDSLAKANRLEHLDLSNTIFVGNRYDMLCSMTSLKELKINYKREFTDKQLGNMSANGNFVELHVAGCPNITEHQLIEFIRKNPLLKVLDVSHCKVTEGLIFAAIDIRNAPRLVTFIGSRRRLKMIVGGTSIRPGILKHPLVLNNRYLLEISFERTAGMHLYNNQRMYEQSDSESEASGDCYPF